jgi:hypothetical protein
MVLPGFPGADPNPIDIKSCLDSGKLKVVVDQDPDHVDPKSDCHSYCQSWEENCGYKDECCLTWHEWCQYDGCFNDKNPMPCSKWQYSDSAGKYITLCVCFNHFKRVSITFQ